MFVITKTIRKYRKGKEFEVLWNSAFNDDVQWYNGSHC